MNKSFIAGLLTISVTLPVIAFAESGPALRPAEVRQERMEERAELREERQEQMAERKEEMAEAREERRAEFEARREEWKTAFEARREEMKTRMEERREAMKAKLAEWKDQRKAEVTERISENLDKVNAKLTERAAAHVEKLNEVLTRINEADKDDSGTADIAAAQTAIDDAQDAVEAQAAKTYSLGSVEEATVGSVASAARAQLKADLEVMFTAIKNAREAVRKAATHIDARADEDDGNASTTE